MLTQAQRLQRQCGGAASLQHAQHSWPPGNSRNADIEIGAAARQLGAPAIPDTKGFTSRPDTFTAACSDPWPLHCRRARAHSLCSSTTSSRQPSPLTADSQQLSRQLSRMGSARSTNTAAAAPLLLLLCLTLAATAAQPAAAQDNIWQALQSLPGLTNFTCLIQGVPSLYNLTQDDNASQTFFAPTDEVRRKGKALHE